MVQSVLVSTVQQGIVCRWDTEHENDGGVNNDQVVRKFLGNAIAGGVGVIPQLPLSMTVKIHNPGTQSAARGIQILQLFRPFAQAGQVSINWNCERKDEHLWELHTSNVRRLRLYPGVLIKLVA